ncbi:transglutaminase domain-containing protein [candidate division KSB1 bacterium]|nr:transglutaminase domain-containing protein [candidate division KSB1 bacterium]
MNQIKRIFITIFCFTCFHTSGWSQRFQGRSSLHFRGGLWHPKQGTTNFQFTNAVGDGEVRIDTKLSGTVGIDYFHWMTDNFALGITLGGMIRHEGYSSTGIGFKESGSHQIGMIPFHVGARFNLLPYWDSSLRPYLAAGGGLYWGFESVDANTIGSANVESSNTIESESIQGGYWGCGIDVLLVRKGLLEIEEIRSSSLSKGFLGTIFSTGIGLNFDYRYHFIRSGKVLGGQKYWSGSEFSLGLVLVFGKPKISVEVQKIELLTTDIYPAFYKHYADFPVGWVTLKNTTRKLIEARVAIQNYEYMTHATYTDFVEIAPRSAKTIPVTALFNENITRVRAAKPATIDFIIETRTIDQFRFTKSTKCVIHSRNGWNGDVSKLKFFVTPTELTIMDLTRSFLKTDSVSAQTDTLNEPENLVRARKIFERIKKQGIRYEPDPNMPYYKNDYVQYPNETLERKTGDCDDLAVLYASMLESVGIRTAFIDVRNYESRTSAHVYVMFDSGILSAEGWRISSNEKKYIIRTQSSDESTLWIPVETTLLTKNFQNAWNAAALDYLREAVINRGLENGTVKIVDVD